MYSSDPYQFDTDIKARRKIAGMTIAQIAILAALAIALIAIMAIGAYLILKGQGKTSSTDEVLPTLAPTLTPVPPAPTATPTAAPIPDITGLTLTREDLPSNWFPFDDETLLQTIATSMMSETNLIAQNVFAFGDINDISGATDSTGYSWIAGGVFTLSDGASIQRFDATLESTEVGSYFFSITTTIEIKSLENIGRFGEKSAGWQVKAISGQKHEQTDLILFRMRNIGVFVLVSPQNPETSSIRVTEIAQKLADKVNYVLVHGPLPAPIAITNFSAITINAGDLPASFTAYEIDNSNGKLGIFPVAQGVGFRAQNKEAIRVFTLDLSNPQDQTLYDLIINDSIQVNLVTTAANPIPKKEAEKYGVPLDIIQEIVAVPSYNDRYGDRSVMLRVIGAYQGEITRRWVFLSMRRNNVGIEIWYEYPNNIAPSIDIAFIASTLDKRIRAALNP